MEIMSRGVKLETVYLNIIRINCGVFRLMHWHFMQCA